LPPGGGKNTFIFIYGKLGKWNGPLAFAAVPVFLRSPLMLPDDGIWRPDY
jgi:hypothetical protein